MKFHTLLSLRHQILARCVRNLFDILYIHRQTMCIRIILNTSANPYPVSLFNHIELSELFTILRPTLHRKTWSIISYFKINDNTSCLRFTLFNIKDISLKDNSVFFRININHRGYLSRIKACLTLALFLGIFWTLLKSRSWYRFTFNNRLKNLFCLRFSLLLQGNFICFISRFERRRYFFIFKNGNFNIRQSNIWKNIRN